MSPMFTYFFIGFIVFPFWFLVSQPCINKSSPNGKLGNSDVHFFCDDTMESTNSPPIRFKTVRESKSKNDMTQFCFASFLYQCRSSTAFFSVQTLGAIVLIIVKPTGQRGTINTIRSGNLSFWHAMCDCCDGSQTNVKCGIETDSLHIGYSSRKRKLVKKIVANCLKRTIAMLSKKEKVDLMENNHFCKLGYLLCSC